MSEQSADALLRQLGRHAEDRQRADLEREGSLDHDPRLRAASRPLDAEAQARIVEHLKTVIPDQQQPPLRPETQRPKTQRQPPPSSRFRRRLVLPLAATLVVAVSALVYQSMIESPSAVAPPPHYTLSVAGSVQTQRGVGHAEQPDQVIHLAPGNRLQVVLTPDQPVSNVVEARAFLAVGEGRWQAVDPAYLAVSESGAIRLDAIVGSELAVAMGVSQLLVVLGPPADLPDVEVAARATLEQGTAAGEAWRAYRITLDLGEPP